MPSPLGAKIARERNARAMSIRDLAKAIGKSPALLSRIENETPLPPVAPETFKAIARALEMNEDEVLVEAGRTEEMAPKTTMEMALYRRVRGMPEEEQQKLLNRLDEEQKG